MANKDKNKSEKYFDRVSKKNKKIKEPIRCYPIVLEEVGNSRGQLLDVGCGEGVLLGYLNEKCGSNLKLSGLDLSGAAIEKASKDLPESVILKQGDAEHLPYEDNSFDVIICTHSFHHYPNPDKALSEFYRCLKKGGKLCIVENYRPEPIRWVRNVLFVLLNHPNGDIKFYSQTELEDLSKKARFSEILSKRITKKSFIHTAIKN